MFAWFSSPSGAAVNSCFIEYYRPSNTLYLLNDAGSAWPSIVVGTSGTLSNSQCSINATTTSVNVSGTDLQLTLPVTFASAYGGAKSINVYAAGSSANSGWQTLGGWTVP
jgi:hypothetical protein